MVNGPGNSTNSVQGEGELEGSKMPRSPEAITLRILSQAGSIRGIDRFSQQVSLAEEQRNVALAEAKIVSLVEYLTAAVNGYVQPGDVRRFFSQDELLPYFKNCENPDLLTQMLKRLTPEQQTDVGHYVGYHVIELLAVPEVGEAVRRHLGNEKVCESLDDFLGVTCSRIFGILPATQDIACFEEYFELLKPWFDCFDRVAYVKEWIDEFEISTLIEELQDPNVMLRALQGFIELTDRRTISNLMSENHDGEALAPLVAAGILDASDSVKPSPEFLDGVNRNLSSYYSANRENIIKLCNKFNGRFKPEMARLIVENLECRSFKVISALAEHGDERLFDASEVRSVVGEKLLEWLQGDKTDLLSGALKLPELFIDLDNSDLTPFTTAWRCANS